MDYLEQVTKLSRWVGVVPIMKRSASSKGEKKTYQMSRSVTLLVLLLQVAIAVLMALEFQHYMTRKGYYPKLRMFQVNVLMYSEVIQSLLTVVSSLLFRYPHMKKLLIRSRIIAKDLGNVKVPFFIKYFGHLIILFHIWLTIYRIDGSKNRSKLLISFSIGSCCEIVVPVLLTANLWLVNTALKEVNSDISKMVKQSSRASKSIQHRLEVLIQKHFAAVNLFSVVKKCFGMDVLVFCFLCLTKTTFIMYHMYWTTVSNLLGTNTMVGGLTGCAQMGFLFICVLIMATFCDFIYNENTETQFLLLLLLKNKFESLDPGVKITANTFILQTKCQSVNFTVYHHFKLTRSFVYQVVLGSVTYVFVLIQFQAINI